MKEIVGILLEIFIYLIVIASVVMYSYFLVNIIRMGIEYVRKRRRKNKE